MRVVIIGSAHPLRGGLATYNERLAKAFMDRGDEVFIYSFSLQYPSFLFPGKSQFSDASAPEKLNIKTSINSINPLSWIKVGNEIKNLKPDLVIVKYWLPFMGPCFGTILRLIKKNKRSKVVSIVDNMIPHEKRPCDNLFTKYFIKPVDGFLAMSKSVLNDISSFDKVKPKIFSPHPLYDNFGAAITKQQAKEKLKLDTNYNYLLFFGFIRDYKGLDLLLNAFADKRFRDLKVKLIIAGEYYTNAEPYNKLIADLQLENVVIKANDFIPDNEVVNYFCAADMVVQPYKSATQSGVTQIAYHFNKPMLVTNVGGLAEIVPHNKVGYVVEPNAKPIADALIDFYTNNREAEMIANTAIEKQKYSWEIMVERILNVAEL